MQELELGSVACFSAGYTTICFKRSASRVLLQPDNLSNYIGCVQRGLDWLPLSLGDVLYGLFVIYGISKIISLLKRVIAGSFPASHWKLVFRKVILFF